MSADLSFHLDYLDGEWRAARAAPLSLRKAMVVASLADAMVDRLAAAGQHDDILRFRAGIAAIYPALAQVLRLMTYSADGPRMEVQPVAVPINEMGRLAVEDFMVSLYNNHSVQRLMIATPDGTQALALVVLADAIDELRSLVGTTNLDVIKAG